MFTKFLRLIIIIPPHFHQIKILSRVNHHRLGELSGAPRVSKKITVNFFLNKKCAKSDEARASEKKKKGKRMLKKV